MENAGSSSQRNPDVDSSFSIPRGGPIFVPDFVTPLTRVSTFESEVFHLLESLKAELGSDSADFDEDISVDELKIYSDEELVSEAMRIAFEDDQMAGISSSDQGQNPCTSGVEDDHRGLVLDLHKSASGASSSGDSSDPSYDGEEDGANFKKKRNGRGKAKARSNRKQKMELISCGKDRQTDQAYLAKVEHLAKLRQKQEADKASVKLHSFSYRNDDGIPLSSGNMTLKCLELLSKGKSSIAGKHVSIRYPEVVLCIEVHHNKHTWKKTQEVLVLGSQLLTELRDKIRCLTDEIMQKSGDHDPSGYFLIEDVFCNDMRNPTAIDYSEPILDWLRNSKEEALAKWNFILSGAGKTWKFLSDEKPVSKLPNFRSVNMEKTRFCDLRFRLGVGYLYCHQARLGFESSFWLVCHKPRGPTSLCQGLRGDCKHVISIRDMRLVHPEDVQNRAAYPLIVYQMKSILKKCSACHIYKATKVTVDDKLAGENPCYFCDNCYYLLHYNADGTLGYDKFQVFEYHQDYY